MPDRINVVQRRSYFRVKVPESLSVEVQLWHCTGVKDKSKLSASSMRPESVGRLVDLSAGGMQIAISAAQKPKFKEGRFVSVKFVAMPSEKPLMFNARIRTVFPTADEKNFSIGLQIVGLETNAEGQEVLSKLIGITEQYYQMSNSGLGRQEMPPVHA
jgi:c-di-GMP-binding flagellar brake protein YcgR